MVYKPGSVPLSLLKSID